MNLKIDDLEERRVNEGRREKRVDELIESSMGDLAGAACIGECKSRGSQFPLGELDRVCSTCSN